MLGEKKLFIGLILATLVIFIGALFLFSKPSSNNSGRKVDSNLLVRDDSQKITSPGATVTLVEFSDYQCPACSSYHTLVKQLINDFPRKMNFVYRNYPLPQHPNAKPAIQAVEAAASQGKFWEMHNLLFEKQSEWSELPNPQETFINYAKELGLNIDQFQKDLGSNGTKQKIERDLQDGNALNLPGTPTFYLNGEKTNNPQSYNDFKALVDNALKNNPQSTTTTIQNYHIHADFKVYLNGNPVDFSQSKYQSPKGKELDPYVHLHNNVGNIIHFHKEGVTLGNFFKSLRMSLPNNCFTLDNGQNYCNSGNKTLKMFVNDKANTQFESYIPQDLDRILITYGSQTEQETQSQINSITDDSCIYSLKCPERGKPPAEQCAGGEGSVCED